MTKWVDVRAQRVQDGGATQRCALAAHEVLDGGRRDFAGLRPLVHDSWLRSLAVHARPGDAVVGSVLPSAELRAHRAAHPLARVMPVIRELLVNPARDAGILVAVADESGRLLWLDGDSGVRRCAEGMAFLEGADWSEPSVGTSAPGTALVTGEAVQIRGAEHFSPRVHDFNCTAVPVRDPGTGRTLGVVDITGGEEAVGRFALPLVRAAVAAAEERLRTLTVPSRLGKAQPVAARSSRATLSVTGRDHGVLRCDDRELRLSTRHSEILVLLAASPRGLAAEELAERLYAQPVPAVTLRAELVRLRRLLEAFDGGIRLDSRPYRLFGVEVDALSTLALLERGSHRQALVRYAGQILPRSQAPGVAERRDELSATLREAVVSSAGVDVLLGYLRLPEAAGDADAWRTALRLLPLRSPRRAGIVAHLESLERA